MVFPLPIWETLSCPPWLRLHPERPGDSCFPLHRPLPAAFGARRTDRGPFLSCDPNAASSALPEASRQHTAGDTAGHVQILPRPCTPTGLARPRSPNRPHRPHRPRGHKDATQTTAARLCDATAPPAWRGTSPGAGLRVDDTRRGGAESLVPWSGVSESQSGGAESEEGKRALSPDLAQCGGSVPVGQGTGVSAEGEAAAPSLSPARR